MGFKSGENPNHPKKDTKIKVEPIREKRHIKKIKQLLADHPRNLCIFTLGINTAFRAGDLLRIKVRDVKHLKAGDNLELKEEKTKKNRIVTLNESSVQVVQGLLNSKTYNDDDYLFTGQRGRLIVSTVNYLVKDMCRRIGLKGNYGSHSLRKTWGFFQWKKFDVPIPILMQAYGHSSQRQTLTYLCIQPKEIKEVFMNEI